MRVRRRPLLAELHAHTTWSDGVLTVRELVDLHGRAGFDVLCVTDHVVRSDDPWLAASGRERHAVPPERYADYLAEIEDEAERARRTYELCVVPGLELTYNDVDSELAAHAVAVGLRQYVSVDGGIEAALTSASAAGAALIAAHPFDDEPATHPARRTQRFARDPRLHALVHRFELFNRTQVFPWVARAGLPAVACGDVHHPEHLDGWKTLVPCPPDERALISYLRSPAPVYVARVTHQPARVAA
jgi:predicted metal-dependent phosphoesterase TrpH